ncbi:conserved exported hypothetical protein [Candidatus Sulfobium mesophilum]|uniref:Ice-binding protein C-terminal domain-containing protein n=1 Tax=Candidatus Sulfobium mesophilum TaxID=2016548 RepID=A0A2U3QE28_9BACT|nr:conserved exported hypothetical protein [Candidatus Sulfobium mesophilum]
MNTQNDNFFLRGVLVFVCLIAMVVALFLPCASVEATLYQQDNLVSDIPGLAAFTDPNLVNPWGIASTPTSPFWISDNGTGLSTLYRGTGEPVPLVVTILPSPGGSPTGVVFNTGAVNGAFGGDVFLFVSEDGTISGWRGALGTFAEVLQTADSANVYKGTTVATVGGHVYLYSANFRAGTIDVLKGDASAPSLTGNFTDPTLPSGYAPFNIQNINGNLYVTYALQDAAKADDVSGAGNGIVDVFDANGNFIKRLISNGLLSPLNSPWGMAIAPTGFGEYSNDLLIGNFGDGRINAFDPVTGAQVGTLEDVTGNPLVIPGLWGLRFGNGGIGFDSSSLYFTAGIPGDGFKEDHGLFGRISVPEPSTFLLLGAGLAGVGLIRRKLRR